MRQKTPTGYDGGPVCMPPVSILLHQQQSSLRLDQASSLHLDSLAILRDAAKPTRHWFCSTTCKVEGHERWWCFNWSNFCWARHFYWSDPAPRSQKLVHWLKGGKWVFCYSRCAAEPPSNCHGLAKSQARQTVRSVERSLDPRAIDHERASPVDRDTRHVSTAPARKHARV